MSATLPTTLEGVEVRSPKTGHAEAKPAKKMKAVLRRPVGNARFVHSQFSHGGLFWSFLVLKLRGISGVSHMAK